MINYECKNCSAYYYCRGIEMFCSSIKIGKAVKKPVKVEFIIWKGDNLKEIIAFTGLHDSAKKWSWKDYEQVVKENGLKIFTLEGNHLASIGDYIIKGIAGEFYPCKPDIFKETYEEIN